MFLSLQTLSQVSVGFLSQKSVSLKINSKEKKTLGFIESFPPFPAHTSPAGKLRCSQGTGCQNTEDGERKFFGCSDHLLYHNTQAASWGS